MQEEILDDVLISGAANAPVIEKNRATFTFFNLTENELAEKFERFMKKNGYRLEKGTVLKGQYGKGSLALRILFGAFAKRFAWEIEITNEGDGVQLVFSKMAKGYAGGAIGVTQVNKEYKSITNNLVDFHTRMREKTEA